MPQPQSADAFLIFDKIDPKSSDDLQIKLAGRLMSEQLLELEQSTKDISDILDSIDSVMPAITKEAKNCIGLFNELESGISQQKGLMEELESRLANGKLLAPIPVPARCTVNFGNGDCKKAITRWKGMCVMTPNSAAVPMVGIEVDYYDGTTSEQSEGMLGGMAKFECTKGLGAFVRPDQISSIEKPVVEAPGTFIKFSGTIHNRSKEEKLHGILIHRPCGIKIPWTMMKEAIEIDHSHSCFHTTAGASEDSQREQFTIFTLPMRGPSYTLPPEGKHIYLMPNNETVAQKRKKW